MCFFPSPFFMHSFKNFNLTFIHGMLHGGLILFNLHKLPSNSAVHLRFHFFTRQNEVHHEIGTLEQAGFRAKHLVSYNHKSNVDTMKNLHDGLFPVYRIQHPCERTGLLIFSIDNCRIVKNSRSPQYVAMAWPLVHFTASLQSLPSKLRNKIKRRQASWSLLTPTGFYHRCFNWYRCKCFNRYRYKIKRSNWFR